MIQQNGEINPGDLVALLQDATAMEVAADIVTSRWTPPRRRPAPRAAC
jgi:hypothetical protein